MVRFQSGYTGGFAAAAITIAKFMELAGVRHMRKVCEFVTHYIVAKFTRQKHKSMAKVDGAGRSTLAERAVTAHYVP